MFNGVEYDSEANVTIFDNNGLSYKELCWENLDDSIGGVIFLRYCGQGQLKEIHRVY